MLVAEVWGCSANLSPSPVVPALANAALLLSAGRAVGKERSRESAQREKGSGFCFFILKSGLRWVGFPAERPARLQTQ